MAKPEPHLRAAETARRFGVSVKALRLYEAQGLIRAERTPAGWRVYGPEQIARLHQILALKSFGFSLGRISALLSGGVPDLATFLELQENLLRQEGARLDRALRLVTAARVRHAERGSLSSDDLMCLTKETAMTDKPLEDLEAAYAAVAARHFSPTDRDALAARGFEGLHRPSEGWDALHAEAARLMRLGDPDSPAAMDLARRWMGKVFEVTGGDTLLTRKMKAAARETLEQPAFAAASSSSVAMMDFVSKAYGAAIATGLMPDPEADGRFDE